jgi:hypothetical protein
VTVTLQEVEAALESIPHESGAIIAHQVTPGRLKRLAFRPPIEGGGAVLIVLGADKFEYPDRPSKPLALDARRRPEPTPDARILASVPTPPEHIEEDAVQAEDPPSEVQEEGSGGSEPTRRGSQPPPRPAPLQRRMGVMPSDRPETFDDRD